MLDVLIIGAGLSGIGAARHLQARCPSKRWAILEARDDLGGTWDLFRYPGVRSDSDMYTLGYAFKPWTESKAIADGATILRYLREAADEADITSQIQFGQAVRQARWSTEEAAWTLDVETIKTGERSQFRTRFLYLCCGYYSYAEGHHPAFPDQDSFKGTLVYPQFWPADLDYAGKQVVVIGSGATAATLVPAMAKKAAHVTMLQRSPTYMVARPSDDAAALWLYRNLPRFLAYDLTRWKNVLVGMFLYRLLRRWPQRAKHRLVGLASKALGPEFDVGKHFTPRYNPWDQRVCALPDGDLFEQIKSGRASVVTDQIARLSANGIELASGEVLTADVIVSATGLKLNVLGDIELSLDGAAFDPSKALTYKGMMLSDLPNCVMTYGYTNASWTLKADLTASYVCRLLNFMDRHQFTVASPEGNPREERLPFLGFTSGYVQRSIDALPKQGRRWPWRVYQNYLADLLAIRWSRIDDGVMRFESSFESLQARRATSS
jgi:cyclohexanone monooxygenase